MSISFVCLFKRFHRKGDIGGTEWGEGAEVFKFLYHGHVGLLDFSVESEDG